MPKQIFFEISRLDNRVKIWRAHDQRMRTVADWTNLVGKRLMTGSVLTDPSVNWGRKTGGQGASHPIEAFPGLTGLPYIPPQTPFGI